MNRHLVKAVENALFRAGLHPNDAVRDTHLIAVALTGLTEKRPLRDIKEFVGAAYGSIEHLVLIDPDAVLPQGETLLDRLTPSGIVRVTEALSSLPPEENTFVAMLQVAALDLRCFNGMQFDIWMLLCGMVLGRISAKKEGEP